MFKIAGKVMHLLEGIAVRRHLAAHQRDIMDAVANCQDQPVTDATRREMLHYARRMAGPCGAQVYATVAATAIDTHPVDSALRFEAMQLAVTTGPAFARMNLPGSRRTSVDAVTPRQQVLEDMRQIVGVLQDDLPGFTGSVDDQAARLELIAQADRLIDRLRHEPQPEHRAPDRPGTQRRRATAALTAA